ncbi:MAG: BON domain-containing protein [Rickettsiaceae bacterium]|nr:BON domain-containing protein [Rickettsiaceae bacterium]
MLSFNNHKNYKISDLNFHILFIAFCLFLFSYSCAFANVNIENIYEVIHKENHSTYKNIKLEYKKPVIYVYGDLNTRLEAGRLVEIISRIKGVQDVNTDNLKIKASKEFLTDAYITAKAKGRISYLALTGKIDDTDEVHVETTNNVIYLLGTVYKKQDIKIIEESLSHIIDARGIKNSLKCSTQPKKIDG